MQTKSQSRIVGDTVSNIKIRLATAYSHKTCLTTIEKCHQILKISNRLLINKNISVLTQFNNVKAFLAAPIQK